MSGVILLTIMLNFVWVLTVRPVFYERESNLDIPENHERWLVKFKFFLPKLEAGNLILKKESKLKEVWEK